MPLKKMFLLLTPLLASLTSCIDLHYTFTLHNNLVSSVQAEVSVNPELADMAATFSAMATDENASDFTPIFNSFIWEQDGLIERVQNNNQHKSLLVRLPSAALTNARTYQQAVDRATAFIEQEESLDFEKFTKFFPVIDGQRLVFDFSEASSTFAAELGDDDVMAHPMFLAFFGRIPLNLRFVSADATAIADIYTIDVDGQKTPIDFMINRSNEVICHILLRDLFSGIMVKLVVELK
jgi:hypothetical protein